MSGVIVYYQDSEEFQTVCEDVWDVFRDTCDREGLERPVAFRVIPDDTSPHGFLVSRADEDLGQTIFRKSA